jgi:hypothetical protein
MIPLAVEGIKSQETYGFDKAVSALQTEMFGSIT